MPTAHVKAPAKINLTLDIVGKRPDGYHLMEMVMQTIDLCNQVSISLTGTPDTFLYCNNSEVPCDKRNLACKAAACFFEATAICPCGLDITLQKAIPMAAGLAGGSADAAATLVALNAIFKTGFSMQQLSEIGIKVGADVPFCIEGGTSQSTGVGELLTPLRALPYCEIVVAKPIAGALTANCFARFDRVGAVRRPDTAGMLDAISAGNLQEIGSKLCNVFEDVVELEGLNEIKQIMNEGGALGSAMSGSGTAIFGIFDDRRRAKHCAYKLKGRCASVFIAHPVVHGAQLVGINR